MMFLKSSTAAKIAVGLIALNSLTCGKRPTGSEGTGDIELLTVPSGADVTVRKVQGPRLSEPMYEARTPDTLRGLDVATYSFEISKDGYRDTTIGRGIAPDYQVSLNVALTPLPPK